LLNGFFAPTQSELDDTPLELESGEIPADLIGTYCRNGPNASMAGEASLR
jgi:carotenoid cleavage dioxygenase-like enzyme